MFHPSVATWFARRFKGPSPAQERAWPVIAAGRDILITAPTGSGKTLAAFLSCLNELCARACEGTLEDTTYALYVSPLKALSNDVQKNLEEPIREIAEVARELGLGDGIAGIRTAVRTGDTPMAERQKSSKRPPHVLVTTPESLFILLTSTSGRRSLSKVRTIVVDEIHAVAPDKRGAHLALSIERLEDLVVSAGNARPQRIGLSATIRPIEVAADLLVGRGPRSAPPVIVDTSGPRHVDLAIEVPKDELGAACTNEQWTELYDRLASLAREHRSTLVFTNTRRLVERIAMHLGERLGEEAVAAHHGALSRGRRHLAEQRLKAGELKVVVATASLELGIDVGSIDLSCIVGSPRAIGVALQRVGRSGHAFGGTPKGRLFPLTRDQLLECAAIVRASRRGVLDKVALREWPLDVLAQQIVAIAAAEDRAEDEVFDLVKSAAPYKDLTRETYDQVITMLAEGVSARRGRMGALLHRDGVERRIKGRRGSRLAALTSGGAIPDTADYDVLLQTDGERIGKLNEDFAIESAAGDVFLLGNNSWRIKRVETGKVWVEDAHGQAPTVPFWLGEAPGRSLELSGELADLRREIASRVLDDEPLAHTTAFLAEECALDEAGARLARDYVAAAQNALGAVPTLDTVVAERFFDEAGGMQLILHAPFGARINRAWGMALRKRFCRSFDFELQAAATDDGVLLSLGPQHSFPLESLLELLDPEGLEDVLEQAALQAPMFGTRFRWDASRSLALLRFQGGRKVPPAIQRMRSDDLLAAVFPAAQGCQDNHGGAKIEPPDHPIVNEAMRDCLFEVMDADGLADVLRRLRSGEIRFVTRETPEPSVLSHEILNANPYAFLDDAPLEERRSRAVSVRRGLPAELVNRLGGLDEGAVATILAEARPEVRDADELHDLLLEMVAIPEDEVSREGWGEICQALAQKRRAGLARLPSGLGLWVAAERRSHAAAIWKSAVFEPELVDPAGLRELDRDEALTDLLRGRMGRVGPVTASELGRALGIETDDADIALARLELEGGVLRGTFRNLPPPEPAWGGGPAPMERQREMEWCDRRLLARIHRLTVAGLRKAIEPALPADVMRFLFTWQGLRGAAHRGRQGLLRAIDQLQGFELAAGAWEAEVLPKRVRDYEPGWLDELCLSGEVVWGRFARRDTFSTPTRAAVLTIARRKDLGFLCPPREDDETGLSEGARAVLRTLREQGASFLEELPGPANLGRSETEDALWELCAAGRVTGDGFSGLRALIDKRKPRSEPAWRVGRFRGGAAPIASGRWSLLRPRAVAGDPEAIVEERARQYLRRYGVVFRDLLAREAEAPPWRELVRVYRRLELRGELRGGRLMTGSVGEQFALPEALDALRAVRREPKTDEVIRISACDPLNLAGILTTGPRIPAHLGAWITYRDGVPDLDDTSGSPPAVEVGEAQGEAGELATMCSGAA